MPAKKPPQKREYLFFEVTSDFIDIEQPEEDILSLGIEWMSVSALKNYIKKYKRLETPSKSQWVKLEIYHGEKRGLTDHYENRYWDKEEKYLTPIIWTSDEKEVLQNIVFILSIYGNNLLGWKEALTKSALTSKNPVYKNLIKEILLK